MTNVIIYLIFFLTSLFLSDNVFAALKINEVYPAPAHQEFEWVEIFNDDSQSINLSTFYLSDENNKQINFSTQNIDPLGFTIATSSSVLNNDGDTVYLKNNQGETLDMVNYSEKFSSDKSLVNCPDGSGSWFILSDITKNASNNTACLSLSPTSLPERVPSPTLPSSTTPNPTPPDYTNIFLWEVMVDPKTGSNEWVEIYNDNDFVVLLNDWYIDDLENAGSVPKKFSLSINSKSYGTFELSSSMFNNDGDSVRLLDFSQIEKDSFQYQSSEKGSSLGRINLENDTFCLQSPSKGKANNPCFNPSTSSKASPTPSPTPSITPTPIPSPTKIKIVKKSIGSFSASQTGVGPTNIDSQEKNVLGVTSEKEKLIEPKVQAILKSFSFVSFSYSLLAISSILYKLKMGI